VSLCLWAGDPILIINGIGQGHCGVKVLNGTVSGAGQPPCNWALIKAVASLCSAPRTRLRLTTGGGASAPVDVFIDGVSVVVVEVDAARVNPVLIPGPVRLNAGQRVAVAICVYGQAPDSVLVRVVMDQVWGREGKVVGKKKNTKIKNSSLRFLSSSPSLLVHGAAARMCSGRPWPGRTGGARGSRASFPPAAPPSPPHPRISTSPFSTRSSRSRPTTPSRERASSPRPGPARRHLVRRGRHRGRHPRRPPGQRGQCDRRHSPFVRGAVPVVPAVRGDDPGGDRARGGRGVREVLGGGRGRLYAVALAGMAGFAATSGARLSGLRT